MIISPLIARIPTILPQPTGAYPLPGADSILNRIAPGGVAPPSPSEALTTLNRDEYLAMPYLPAVQGHTYATNPRKDGTTPILSSYQDLNITTKQTIIRTTAPIARNDTDREKSSIIDVSNFNKTANRATVVSSPRNAANFNRTVNQAAAINPTDQTKAIDWVALLILGGIAFFTFVRYKGR